MKDIALSLLIMEHWRSPNSLCYVRSAYLASGSSVIDLICL